jgi:hypothetical protein
MRLKSRIGAIMAACGNLSADGVRIESKCWNPVGDETTAARKEEVKYAQSGPTT